MRSLGRLLFDELLGDQEPVRRAQARPTKSERVSSDTWGVSSLTNSVATPKNIQRSISESVSSLIKVKRSA